MPVALQMAATAPLPVQPTLKARLQRCCGWRSMLLTQTMPPSQSQGLQLHGRCSSCSKKYLRLSVNCALQVPQQMLQLENLTEMPSVSRCSVRTASLHLL